MYELNNPRLIYYRLNCLSFGSLLYREPNFSFDVLACAHFLGIKINFVPKAIRSIFDVRNEIKVFGAIQSPRPFIQYKLTHVVFLKGGCPWRSTQIPP